MNKQVIGMYYEQTSYRYYVLCIMNKQVIGMYYEQTSYSYRDVL